MITVEQLRKTTVDSGLNLYQQEKDYLLKQFLYNYYQRHSKAVFKGGTCLRYLHGLKRFSVDLDFNLQTTPKEFKEHVRDTLKDLSRLGIVNHFIREEVFKEAYTCEIGFQGPMHASGSQSRNKFRIDAGTRTGTILEPQWRLMKSEYPDTPPSFLVQAMDEREILAEKMLALQDRMKGRDLYDTWFLLEKGVKPDKKLLDKKAGRKTSYKSILENTPTEQEYLRDVRKLTSQVIPYKQVKKDLEKHLQ